MISLYNDHGNLPWPPLDDLLVGLISLHSSRPQTEIEPFLPTASPGS